MAEISLRNALDNIRSEKVNDRKDGLTDLRRILTQNKRSSKLEALNDKAYHRIFESLFWISRVESSTYARSSSRAPAKAQAASRLSACAGVLRIGVELGVQKLRYKTVKALIDHIIQTLPNSDEGYCAPLVLDYFKTLRAILDYQPHSEHLPKDAWHELTDFCLESVGVLNSSLEDGDSTLSHRLRASDSFSDARSRSVTPSVRDSARRSTQRTSQRSVNTTLKDSAEDVVLCLRNLHSIPNAPITEKAEVTLHALLELLKKSSNASHLQQAAFDCMNTIIARIATEDSDLMSQTLRSLIPLICRFWQGKSPALRDSMLVSLLYGESYFVHLLNSDGSGDLKADLQSLLEGFKDDYCKRMERDKLQVEDLDLSQGMSYNERQVPMGLTAFRPRLGLLKAEQPWTMLQVSTSIIRSLDSQTSVSNSEAEIDDATHSSKRRKLQSAHGEVIQNLKTSQASERVYALQLLSFLISDTSVDKRILQQSLGDLLLCLSDNSDPVVSWAMLAISCGALRSVANDPEFGSLWLQTWRVCARHTTSSATCRPACHLMASLLKNGLLRYPQVKDLAEGMLSSVDSNGPADAVDATIDFWATAATLRAAENLGSAHDTVERVLRWLFVRWSPRTLFDRQHTAQSAQLCPTSSVLHLLLVCLGSSVRVVDSSRAPSLGRVGQACLNSLESRDLVRYILLQEDFLISKEVDGAPKNSQAVQIPLSSAQSKRTYELIIDHLLTEISITKRELSSGNVPGSQSITTDMIQVVVSMAAVGYAMLAHTSAAGSHKVKDLQAAVNDLMEITVKRILYHESRGDLMSAIYESLAAFPLCTNRAQHGHVLLQASLIGIAKHLYPHLEQPFEAHATSNGITARDADEFDEDFESQTSHSKRTEENVIMDGFNDETAAATNYNAFQASQAAKVGCASRVSFPYNAENAGAFVDYLTSLQPREFLSCRHLINEVLNSDLQLDEKDVCKVLEYLAQEVLPVYEFERSGSSMGVCLDIMTAFAEVWTSSESSEVGHVGATLYGWFINVALDRGISSPHVYVCISSMLRRVIKIRPEYARSLSLVSARTSLFQVLSEGGLSVKYIVGKNISEIFGLFVLKEHDNILADIIDNLPNAVDWLEGLAVRLYVLAQLGAAWSTLLRQCIFRLFETPGHIPASTGHAKLCMDFISKALDLGSTRELFKLFVPQILYTWLETQTLKTIPYSIFGYKTITELLQDIQDEVVGQVVMRGKDDAAAELTLETGESYGQLVETSFSKVSAYCMARDIAIPPAQATQAAGAETRLRKIMGKDQYASLIAMQFPSILVNFYNSLDQEGQIIKGFQKHPMMKGALTAYEAMTAISASEKPVPANQQPAFKASFLVDEIDHLCNRTSYEIDSMWSPALFVKVFRDLINTIHPALGSLHACSVLRRIRIMVCMAGPTALALYPLEMMLHSFRPFLTDLQCSDDTIGMVQYLLDQGAPYVNEIPRFLAGTAVSTLISMKAFLASTQDSTTQESQHQATMTKAQQFHAWFAQYLNEYDSPQLLGATQKSFKTIVKVSRNVQAKGNARRGTYESDLMMELFDDERSGRNLFNQPSRDLILGLLCSSFEAPPNFRDDVAGSDEQAAVIANAVWTACLRVKCGHNFLLWAARVLGRAFATSGSVHCTALPEEQSDVDRSNGDVLTNSPSSQSKLAILKSLGDFVLVDNREEVGMAEQTLRAIVNGAKGTDDFSECEQLLPPSLMESMVWTHYGLPIRKYSPPPKSLLADSAAFDEFKPATVWVQRLCIALALSAGPDSMLSQLPPILETVKALPRQIFPYVLHLALFHEAGGHEITKSTVSKAFREWFGKCSTQTTSQVRILLEAVLYLRKQPLPNESAQSDRSRWLDINYKEAAKAATQCSMFKTALMFLEIDLSEAAKAPRRSSVTKGEGSPELLLEIYEHIDEQDSIYGVQQPSSLATLMERLEYERAGFKSLSFRGAHYDSQLRRFKKSQREDEEGVVRILNTLNLHGLSQSILSKVTDPGPSSVDSMLSTARKLEHWDISVPTSHRSDASTVFKALQGIVNAPDKRSVASSLEVGLSETMELLTATSDAASPETKILHALAVLTEADEAFSSTSTDQLHEACARFQSRIDWMDNDSFGRIDGILSCRETLFSSLSKSDKLQHLLRTTQHEARVAESSNLLANSRLSRSHGALQHALTRATYLTGIVEPCESAGVIISAAAQFESARVLWDQGEMSTSIKMLEDLLADPHIDSQSIKVGRPELLARLGHQIAEARLEKPDEIIRRYLTPAIKELQGATEGDEAGQVYHEFASFCDQQLQNADGLEDFQRIQRLRERKEAEVQDLERMIKSGPSQGKERDNLKSYRSKAKQWYDIDNREYQRLRDSREAFLRQSLENYLLCLQACDKYDNDALRFAALWLENWSSAIANSAVSEHMSNVGSGKFASLMNQWSSRLLENTNDFQKLLSALVTRICIEHPYHGIYQLFAGSKTKGKDDTAISRHNAASAIVNIIKHHKTTGPIWISLHNTSIIFVKFAQEKLDESKAKPGAKVALRKTNYGQKMENDVKHSHLPPPTMSIPLRPNRNYSDIPTIARWQPEFSIASGISMPKIATAITTDGKKFKQLFKSGNDDLRQDAIMEQVFAQVSALLRAQRSTRQRSLGIRTYKVLPLTATSGIIEFVPNTMPLHEYLIPAHTRHFPKDLKPNTCRKYIAEAQSKSAEKRIDTYRKVTRDFHPVLRYFFMERFENPDEWFERRLAYTRSTAAISILGHVLGLGDRHGHNILLDEKTGEVVHIDLGIAFEQGRVLPVPEVVPFRLTRDVVDGMGITKTEGVFRRCCEFTLEALRNESYSIMTILDVLRYDPLYSWSLSPLRLAKMQEAQTEAPPIKGEDAGAAPARKGGESEPGEADRALTVVAKKLSRSLSVVATVNELIQQATDERNLALLFCGWAAYA